MALKYVLNSMKRRKLRTAIVLIALVVGVALVGALLTLVDTQRQYSLQTVGDQVGTHDLTIRRNDLAVSPFFDAVAVTKLTDDAYPDLAAIHPRIQGTTLARTDKNIQDYTLTVMALDTEADKLNKINPITQGSYPPAHGQVFLNTAAADLLRVGVGEELKLSYVRPVQRQSGKAASEGVSVARTDARFIVAGIGEISGIDDTPNTVFMRLDDAQQWLGQSGVERLLVLWNPDARAGSDAKLAVSFARDIGEQIKSAIQDKLGKDFVVDLRKYNRLNQTSQQFVFQQSFITIYGLLSMGIIGLMVNALMMTTVNESKRDLAILRVLGAPRARLLEAVIVEVVIIGTVGVIGGIILGRIINDFIAAPILLRELDLPAGVQSSWSLRSVLTPTLITMLVLALATITPARTAANTKVMVVLNPAAADQPSLDDLSKLRERRANFGLLGIGIILLIISSSIFFLFPLLFSFGDQSLFANVFFASLILMVLGMSFVFYFTTMPLERLLLILFGVVSRRASFFASRYALRGKGRNALISLMVVASAVLPCLLAAQLTLTDANIDTDARYLTGTTATAQLGGGFLGGGPGGGGFSNVRAAPNQRIGDDVFTEAKTQTGVRDVVAVAQDVNDQVSDRVQLRQARARYIGVNGDLRRVLFTEFIQFQQGDASALGQVVFDPNAIIISAALGDALDLKLGDTMRVKGAGLDHERNMRIVGVAQRLPGFITEITSNRNNANGGSTGIIMGMEAYRDLRNDPAKGAADPSEAVYSKLLIRGQAGVNERALGRSLRDTFSRQRGLNVSVTSEQVAQARSTLEQGRIFVLVLTVVSMITAVFGVLAVMYTAVLGRRVEIGMLKAIGASGGDLRSIFIGEAMVTTLAAALAGIIAGTILGYLFALIPRFTVESPMLFAFDWRTAAIICATVSLAAIFSSWLATRPVLRSKAIVILRDRGS